MKFLVSSSRLATSTQFLDVVSNTFHTKKSTFNDSLGFDRIIVSFIERKILFEHLSTTKTDITFFLNLCNSWRGESSESHLPLSDGHNFSPFPKNPDFNYSFGGQDFQYENDSLSAILVGSSLELDTLLSLFLFSLHWSSLLLCVLGVDTTRELNLFFLLSGVFRSRPEKFLLHRPTHLIGNIVNFNHL